MPALETASVLAFERKLDPSDAVFSAGNWDDFNNAEEWRDLTIRSKSVRGTISNRLKTKDQDPAKLDAATEKPNLQTVDVVRLPKDSDTLKVQFTLRVLAGAGQPSACNNLDYRKKLVATIDGYAKKHGFNELAHRYAANLANGRFLWRNRIGAEKVSIHVAHLQEGKAAQEWEFDALHYPLRKFTKSDDYSELATLIDDGLSGKTHVLLQVTAFVRIGAGQEVFPSQELVLDRERGQKSKTLYDVDGVAAIHSQKIGNALRTIDTWYKGADENGPIAVEPYGSVTVQGKAWRQPKEKHDFYTLLDNWIIKDVAPPDEQQHYVVAVLIRGGVFGKVD